MERMTHRILWGVTPPPSIAKSWIRVLVVKAGQTHQVRILGPALGVMTHYDPEEKRSIACLGAKHCPRHGLSQEWKGYVAACTPQAKTATAPAYWRETVLLISRGIAADVAALPAGCLVEIRRLPGKANNPLELRVMPRQPEDEPLAPFDVRPYVLRAMGLSEEIGCKLRLRRAE